MAGTKKCPLKKGVHSWEVKNVGFICAWDRPKKCALKRGVHSYEVKNVGFICAWDQQKCRLVLIDIDFIDWIPRVHTDSPEYNLATCLRISNRTTRSKQQL